MNERYQGIKASRHNLNGFFIFVVLFSLVFLTRFPFRTRILYDWDSVQFALGMRHFDVSLFQPHPPGYFFYVMSARAVNFLVHDENTSLVLLSILGSAIALYFTFLLGLRMFSKEVAVAATALLFTSPLFWMFGLIGNPDIFDAAFSAWFAYLAWRVLKGEAHLLPYASLLLGIATGFRTGLLIFLGPLWLYVVVKSGKERLIKNFALSAMIVGICICVWLIPSAYLSHGMKSYLVSFKQSSASFIETSIFRAGFDGVAANAGMLVMSLFFGGLCFFSIHYLLFPLFHLFLSKNKMWGGGGKSRGTAFGDIWLLPAILFLCFIHNRYSAFVLFLLPAFFLKTAFLAYAFYSDFHSAGKIKMAKWLFFSLFMSVFFLLNIWASSSFIPKFIQYANNDWVRRERFIESHFDKNKTLLVTSFYASGICKDCDRNYFRHAMYYLQDYKVYFLPEVFNAHSSKKAQMAESGNVHTLHLTKKGNIYEVPLPSGIREVVFIEDMFFNMFSFVRHRYPGSIARYTVSRNPGILFFGIKTSINQKTISLPQKDIFNITGTKHKR